MGFGGAINDLIDTLNRPRRTPSDANPMYAYRRLPQDSATKRLPEGVRSGLGGSMLRMIDPDYGIGWRSHLASPFSESMADAELPRDPANEIGPTRTDRTRAMAFRDAQMASAERMMDTMRTNTLAADEIARAADEIDLENRARRAGRKFPFDASVKYGTLPGLGDIPSAGVFADAVGMSWADALTEGTVAERLPALEAFRQSSRFDVVAPEIQQAVEEQIRLGRAAAMSDSAIGDRVRFQRDMDRIANPPRVGGESAIDMLKRGGGAMGLPALDVLSILMGAAVGRNPIDPGPLPGGTMLYKDTSTGEVFDEDGNSYLENSVGGYSQVY